MMSEILPKLSVIIHFLNAAQYLPQALESVFRQTFAAWELILVDGGSTDASIEIAKTYQAKRPAQIRMLPHKGQTTLGIFSSRLWGAQEATAPILALLDSDDEWHPQFLERHYAIYQHVFADRPGMVYCPVVYWWEDPALAAQSYVQPVPSPGLHEPPDLVIPFLEDGYQRSAANSGVMIARDLVLEAKSLIGTANEGMVEDQYLWSFLLLRYPVFISPEPFVRYRQWSDSTCAKTVRDNQATLLRAAHLQWLHTSLPGIYHGNKSIPLLQALREIIERETPSTQERVPLLTTEHVSVTPSFLPIRQRVKTIVQTVLSRILPPSFYRLAYRLLQRLAPRLHHWLRPVEKLWARGRLAVGVHPLSHQWGFDRGLPVHRYYIEQFLAEWRDDIQGRCLEFQENYYTTRFGGSQVVHVDILHNTAENSAATIIADLTDPATLPENVFDCIICTHVLHLIFNHERAIQGLYHMLTPHGVLLLAVPQVSMYGPEWHELWRYTAEGLQMLLEPVFGSESIIVRAYGNSLTAAGELRGVTVQEFRNKELQAYDVRCPLEVCARAVKRV